MELSRKRFASDVNHTHSMHARVCMLACMHAHTHWHSALKHACMHAHIHSLSFCTCLRTLSLNHPINQGAGRKNILCALWKLPVPANLITYLCLWTEWGGGGLIWWMPFWWINAHCKIIWSPVLIVWSLFSGTLELIWYTVMCIYVQARQFSAICLTRLCVCVCVSVSLCVLSVCLSVCLCLCVRERERKPAK